MGRRARCEPAVGLGLESGVAGEEEFGGMGAIVKACCYYKNRDTEDFGGPPSKFIVPLARSSGAMLCIVMKLAFGTNTPTFTASKRLALAPGLGKKRRFLATVIVLETEKILTVQGAY